VLTNGSAKSRKEILASAFTSFARQVQAGRLEDTDAGDAVLRAWASARYAKK